MTEERLGLKNLNLFFPVMENYPYATNTINMELLELNCYQRTYIANF